MVDTELLTELLHHSLLRLLGEEQVYVNTVSGIDKQAQPACRYLRLIALRGYKKIGLILPVHTNIFAVCHIQDLRCYKFRARDVQRAFVRRNVFGNYLLNTL